MTKIKIKSHDILLSLCLTTLFPITSNAQTLPFFIEKALQSNTEVTIAQKQTELQKFAKLDAKTSFLPKISANYTDGTRRTKITNLKDKLSEDTYSATLEQPLFNGFSSIAKVKQAKYSYGATKENLSKTKNEIAFRVVEKYLYSYFLEQISDLNKKNSKILTQSLTLAKQSLDLQDINYSKFTEIAIKKNKVDIELNDNRSKLQENLLALEILTGENNIHNLKKPILPELDELINLETDAQNNNPQIKAQKLNTKAKSFEVISQAGKFAPKASLYLKYEKQDSSQFFNGESVTNKLIYLNLEIPIFQQGSEYISLSKAKKEKQIAILQETLALQEVKKQIKMSYYKYISISDNIKSLTNIITASSKALALSQDRLQQQDIPQLDVLLQESELISMKIQLLKLKLEKYLAYFKIKELINAII